jgi:carboxymethylenebutenolidase
MTFAQRRSFTSGGQIITVEVHGTPGGARPAPAVIMLHGADGLNTNTQYRSGAAGIAAAGFNVFLVHYLDRTQERRASFTTVFENFPLWLDSVRDALTYVSERAEVARDRIGLVGVSLGAALGLVLASRDRRIKALVDYFGPFPQGALDPDAPLPPTLILHGGADRVVPVANAHAIEAMLAQQGALVESKIYPGQGHGFHGAAERDATERVLQFLRRHLVDQHRSETAPLSASG